MTGEVQHATTDVRSADEDPGDGAVTGVVVGVDDSLSARAAVAWAAAAARRRGVGLHLVEVLPSATGGAALGPAAPRGRARALLSRARNIARAACPELPVSMQTLVGRVAPALVSYSVDASLLVVGSNGPGGPIPLSLGAIVGGVTRRCSCPVVLVPPDGTRTGDENGPVVVGLEDTEDGERALAVAADLADRRAVPLVPLVSDQGSGPAAESRLLARVREARPGLDVQPQSITERPADVLRRADADAQLIVVPSVKRGPGRAGSTAGWTGHFLPLLSRCPIAVVSSRSHVSITVD